MANHIALISIGIRASFVNSLRQLCANPRLSGRRAYACREHTSEIDNLDGGILLFSHWVAALWTGSRLIGYIGYIGYRLPAGRATYQWHAKTPVSHDSDGLSPEAIRPHLNHRYRVNPEQRNLQM